MTTVQITLPDQLAQRAKDAGLLSDTAIQSLLEDAMRRQAGRRLMAVASELHAANIAPMSDDEVVALVKEVRAERRARGGQQERTHGERKQ
jgi:post-segregation antitoxin (ccd killing protein)